MVSDYLPVTRHPGRATLKLVLWALLMISMSLLRNRVVYCVTDRFRLAFLDLAFGFAPFPMK